MNKNLTAKIGLWSSVFLAVLGVAYVLILIIFFLNEGFSINPSPFVQLSGGIITFLTATGLLIQFSAICYVKDDHKVLRSLGISFITLFAATVSINRFIQLTVIQQALPDVPSDLSRFLPYAPGSVMLAFEMLGWGFFSSLAAICVAPLFSTSGLNLSIRWLFITYALFSFISVIGYATETPLTSAGFFAWGPILLVLSILLIVYFRNLDNLTG